MLDINQLRRDLDGVLARLETRKSPRPLLDREGFVALESEELTITHLRGVIDRSGMTQPDDAMTPDDQTLECVERRHIAHVLILTNGHRTEAARILGITRTTLYKKMYEYGLDKVGNA